MQLILFTEPNYRKPTIKGNCAIKIGGGKDFHERCQCFCDHISVCKSHCSKDLRCKGYVKVAQTCDLATTSNCTEGCFKYDFGNVGELLVDDDYYTAMNGKYEGCYIKEIGQISGLRINASSLGHLMLLLLIFAVQFKLRVFYITNAVN